MHLQFTTKYCLYISNLKKYSLCDKKYMFFSLFFVVPNKGLKPSFRMEEPFQSA